MKYGLALLGLVAVLADAAPSTPAGLSSNKPVARSMAHRVKQSHKRALLEISVLGGQTHRIDQVASSGFKGLDHTSGPAELLKAYGKFDTAATATGISQAEIQRILRDLLCQFGYTGPLVDCSGTGTGRGGSGSGGKGSGGKGSGGKGSGGKGSGSTGNGGNGNGTSSQTPGNGTTGSGNSSQGDVAALPSANNQEFLCPVQIGNPPQAVNLDFDTGSSDLWVFSTETPQTEVQGQLLYNPSNSSTAKLMKGASWKISYGDGSSASGTVYTDTVTIGGVTVKNQAVEVAHQVAQSFTANSASSGLVGLAFSAINTVQPAQQKTFFANALNTLAMPLFSANLKRSQPGNYNFGFVDPTEFTGEISFVPVNSSRGFWQFESSGFKVGTNAAVSASHLAIADTGTTLFLLPDEIVAEYYAQVPGSQNATTTAGGFVFPCDQTLPDYTAMIGDYEAVVPGKFINFAAADRSGTTCFGGIQSQGTLPFSIYGDVFLTSQFVVFHGGASELGLAAKPL